jgi:MauM/NapG family ferredoxin protein
LGKWIVLVTLGGACFGYPLLLWMDPLAIFQGVFTLFHDPLSLAGRASAGALAIILGMSLLLPGAWCLRICPLGATQEIVALPRRFRTWGTLLACPKPKGTLETCPTRSVSRARTFQTLLPRRSVLSAGVGAVCMGLGARWALDLSTPAVRRRKRPLRPPGAIDERRFPGLCVRCGNCVRACPVGIIKADAASGSVAGFLAPVVDFEEDYCREDCLRCTQVCPSGAITRIAIEDKAGAPIGLAVLEASLCLLADDRECDVCARVCPFEAIKIVWNEEEYIALPQVDAQKCPGCGACEVACPGKNDWEREHADEPIPVRKAIEVHPRNVS